MPTPVKKFIIASKSFRYGVDEKIQSYDDTLLEKLNYRYTVAMVFMVAYIIVVRQIGGAKTNVKCFVPAHLYKYSCYINEYCFMSTTYYFPFDEKLPQHIPQIKNETTENGYNAIRYYHSMQYVLIFVGACVYFPKFLYRLFTLSCDIDLKTLIGTARNINTPKRIDYNQSLINYVVYNFDFHLRKNLSFKSSYGSSKIKMKFLNFFLTNYLIKIFFLVKTFYIFNSFLIMKVISTLLGGDGNFYFYFGYEYFKSTFLTPTPNLDGSERAFSRDIYFPKVTLCDLRVRGLGLSPTNQHENIIQCTLPFNFFLQQIFTFLWFWLIVLSCVNTVDLIVWIFKVLPRAKSYFIHDHFHLNAIDDHDGDKMEKDSLKNYEELTKKRLCDYLDEKSIKDFIENYLSDDGYFILKIISFNCGRLTTKLIIVNLIEKYKQFKCEQKKFVQTNEEDGKI